ncbi:lysine-specific demethylase 8-like [Lineus longissimus]|uniref:lysine-specific demethylase 8-like n=1 Tax=Lineus longissimus TaxID=88925 RepID=UPI00315D2CD3
MSSGSSASTIKVCDMAPCQSDFNVEALRRLLSSPRQYFSLDGVDRSVCGEAYWFLLQDAVERFCSKDLSYCIQTCKCLLDITWEKLNTGHWKDVAITWRLAYSYVSLLKALSEVSMSSLDDKSELELAIKTCDMGLLMGAPVLDNVLSKIVAVLQPILCPLQTTGKEGDSVNKGQHDSEAHDLKRQKVFSMPEISPSHKVPRIHCPSLDYFKKNFMDLENPVILEGCMDYWPALSERKWTLDYIKNVAGYRTVPIEIGAKYTEETWSQKLLSVGEFIDRFLISPQEGSSVGYLAQHQLFDQIPELKNDISVPTYCCLGDEDDVDINAWFGPSGTVSPLHQDPKHNFLAQVLGDKYIKLYPVIDSKFVYPHTEVLLNNTSQVDVENPDLVKFPEFRKARLQECVLRSGEMLYIPKKHWHFVRSYGNRTVSLLGLTRYLKDQNHLW